MTRPRLKLVEAVPVREHVHLVENRDPSYPRQAGLTLTDCLWGIAMAPFDADRLRDEMLIDAPRHLPECFDAPIPGRQWYGGCNPDGGHIHPGTGLCSECGARACRECGLENCPDGCEETSATAAGRPPEGSSSRILEDGAA